MISYPLAFIAGFFITFILTFYLLPKLGKYCKQTVRNDVLAHHSNKEGTPTMGGGFIVFVTIGISLLFFDLSYQLITVISSMILFAMIGFCDDFLKLKRGRGQGLTAKQKTSLMLIASLWVIGYFCLNDHSYNIWQIPFTNLTVDLGYASILIYFLALIGTANAVNLTDGLDGLVLMPMVLILLGLLCIVIAEKLALGSFIALFAGSCLGLLFFNCYPAQLFLGDLGSLSLGATLAVICFVLHKTLFLIAIGMLFVLEALSVIIQVFSFKKFGKRVFKMTPIHHHFELLGWHESKVVFVFWLFALLMVVLSVLFELSVRLS